MMLCNNLLSHRKVNMKKLRPFCGLANSTATTVIGIVQLISSSILCAAYFMGYKILYQDNQQVILKKSTDAVIDFIRSTGLLSKNETAVINITILYMMLYSCKIIFATGLLIAICKNSCLWVKIWLILDISAFSFRLGLFVASLLLTFSSFTTALINVISFLLELFCIWIVYLFTTELSNPSLFLSALLFTEPMRIHCSFKGMKRASMPNRYDVPKQSLLLQIHK